MLEITYILECKTILCVLTLKKIAAPKDNFKEFSIIKPVRAAWNSILLIMIPISQFLFLQIKFCRKQYQLHRSRALIQWTSKDVSCWMNSLVSRWRLFWRTFVLLWGYWYPCFELLVTFHLGFKVRVGSLIRIWQRCMWCMFIEIHLWCDTCWPLDGQHGGQSLPHMCILEEVGYYQLPDENFGDLVQVSQNFIHKN